MFGVLVGVLIGWALFGRSIKLDLTGAVSRFFARRPGNGPPASTAAAPAGEANAGTQALVAAGTQSLAERLAELQGVFAPFAHGSAHPRELLGKREFVDSVALLADGAVPLATVLDYATGISWSLSCVGFEALRQRTDGRATGDRMLAAFPNLTAWPIHFALAALLACEPRPASGVALLSIKDNWIDDRIIPGLFRDHFAACEQLGDTADFGAGLREATPETQELIERMLARIDHPFGGRLAAALRDARARRIDRDFLNSFGRFWPEPPALDLLVEPEPWAATLVEARAAMEQTPVRSLLVSGEPGVGKTQLLRLLARRLAADGWVVFEAGGADLMSGQQWFGQLEGRIRKAVEELAVAKRAIWYIPDIMQIALSGTHQGQAASVLDQILPAIAAGRLAIWTEASPGGTARVLRLRPALRAALEVVRLEPMSDADTARLAQVFIQRVADATALAIDSDAVGVAQGAARQYLSAMSFPGAVLDLLRLTVARAANAGGTAVDASAVMQTLAQLTGLPVSILDGMNASIWRRSGPISRRA